MSEPHLASLRWTVDYDTLTFADGEKIKFPEWVPLELIARLGDLAQDFYRLGNAAAAEVDGARMARRDRDNWKMQAERAEATLRDIRNNDSNENILAILMGDLETAINMIFRFAGMLGIQTGGELYDAINALANKYKMHYTPPKDYSYEGMVAPTLASGAAGGLSEREGRVLIDLTSGTPEIKEIEAPEVDMFGEEHEPDQQYGTATRDWVND
jgi:hypothetical protein